jgi:hypothetical protein
MRAHFRHLCSKSFPMIYKERHKPLRFDPCNRSLKFQKSTGTPSPKVGVALGVWVFTPSHSLTLSNNLESMWCDSRVSFCLNSRASSWLALLQCLCLDSRASFLLAYNLATPFSLGRKPKVRVVTPKVVGVLTLAISGLPLGSPGTKSHFGCGSCGKAQNMLEKGRWWLPPSPGRGESYESELPMVYLSTKSAPTMH